MKTKTLSIGQLVNKHNGGCSLIEKISIKKKCVTLEDGTRYGIEFCKSLIK